MTNYKTTINLFRSPPEAKQTITVQSLTFRRTVSRAQDTPGQTNVTLLVDGTRVARCTGGGYDMDGTCLGEWLQKRFQLRLMMIHGLARSTHVDGEHVITQESGDKLYGMTSYYSKDKKLGRVLLDGGCGWDSMIKIAKTIGIDLKIIPNIAAIQTTYIATYEAELPCLSSSPTSQETALSPT